MVRPLACLSSAVTATVVGAVLLQPGTQSVAADQQQTREALSGLAQEMSTCSAFFALATSVLKRALPEDTTKSIEHYDTAGKLLLAQAIAIVDVIGLDADAPVEWSRVAMQEMVKEINDDPKNSAALMSNKYDAPCQTLLKNSTARFRALVDGDTPD
jgi:hypothetical protein